jgi:hypothetical protein
MNLNHNAKALVGLAAVAPAPIQPPLRVGLLGLGTVGGGTYRVLRRNSQLIETELGEKSKFRWSLCAIWRALRWFWTTTLS